MGNVFYFWEVFLLSQILLLSKMKSTLALCNFTFSQALVVVLFALSRSFYEIAFSSGRGPIAHIIHYLRLGKH